MIYDRADWHYTGDYPPDLPPQNGGTHIGIFFSWLVNRGLVSEQLVQRFPQELAALRTRQLGGREFLAKLCDGQLADSELNATGNAFAREYYDSELYFKDYAETLVRQLPSLYHVDDTWASYDTMAQVIEGRFTLWLKATRRPWWKLW
jgi:hypothetical protein